VDEPGAFTAREWLRNLVIGKQIAFETRKQGASAGDRVYGWLFVQQPNQVEPVHLAVECVRQGYATPKGFKAPGSEEMKGSEEDVLGDGSYESQLMKAYSEAKEAQRGIHATKTLPLVRNVKSAGEEFATLTLVEAVQKKATNKRIKCVIEYVFDGSRLRCQITDDALPEFQYASFTLLLAGVLSPRIGNPKASPPVSSEPFADAARGFVDMRLMQRELDVGLFGTDKSGASAVGTVYHPAGNIAVELLKSGLAKMTDWSVRLMPIEEVPALRGK
jgi:staphylococcal nuclease domain-containing protein 1